jgi:hypothetical protein
MVENSSGLSSQLQRQLEVTADAQRNFQAAEAKHKLLYSQLSAKYRGELLEQKSMGRQAFGLALDNADLATRLNTDAAVLGGERASTNTQRPKLLESKPSGRMDVELAVCARVQQNPVILQQRRLIRSLEAKLTAALNRLSEIQDLHSKARQCATCPVYGTSPHGCCCFPRCGGCAAGAGSADGARSSKALPKILRRSLPLWDAR